MNSKVFKFVAFSVLSVVLLLSFVVLLVFASRRIVQDNEGNKVDFNNGRYYSNNLGGNGFHCTGSCACGESSFDERRAVGVLGRGLTLVVSASSIIAATSIARMNFQEECVSRISDVCETSSIYSDVKCSPAVLSDTDESSDAKEKGNGAPPEEAAEDDKPKVFYECSGKCIANEELGDRLAEVSERFGVNCEELLLKKKWDFPCEEDENCDLMAVQLFFKDSFDSYCTRTSMITDINDVELSACIPEPESKVNCIKV